MTKLFAGLDVADQTTVVCVLDDAGQCVFEQQVATTPDAIASALRPYRRSLKLVGQESGTKASWLHKELKQKKLPAICLDARHTHAALSARNNKTDKNDARGIAIVLQRGMYSEAYIKSDEAQRVRLLLTYRKMLLRKAQSVQLTLATSVKMFGARVESTKQGVRIVYAHRPANLALDELNQSLVRARAALMEEVHSLDRLIEKAAEADPVCRRLMTIPSIGPIAALSFRSAIDDPTRFSSSRTVAAYLGLTPRTYQSGEYEVRGRISKRGDTSVRAALYNSAVVLLSVSKTTWHLRSWGRKLAESRGYKFAAVACARRLAVVMHRLWVSDAEFEPRPGEKYLSSAKADREKRYSELWNALAAFVARSDPMLSNLAAPSTHCWRFSAGKPNLYLTLEARTRAQRAVVHLEIRGKVSRAIFDAFARGRSRFEAEFDDPLEWARRDECLYPRISAWRDDADFSEETWPDLFAWYWHSIENFRRALATEPA